MTEKTAEGSASSKPCPDEHWISIPVDVVDDLVSIADNARSVLSDYRRSIVDGAVRAGLWIGDESAALDLATAVAAIEGLGDIVRELSSIDEDCFSGSETVPDSKTPLMDRVDELEQVGILKFRYIDPQIQPDPEAIAAVKLAARDAADPARAELFKLRQRDGRSKQILVDFRVTGTDGTDGLLSSDDIMSLPDLQLARAVLAEELDALDERLANDWYVE